MNIDEFWELIENIDQKILCKNIDNMLELSSDDEERAIEPLIKKLSELSTIEIKRFEENLYKVLYAIEGEIYADNAGENGTSDDGFLYCRCYVVARGRTYYEFILENPAEIPKKINQYFEALLYVSAEAWSRATGNDLEEWDFFPSVSNEKETNTKKTNKTIYGIRIYDNYSIKDFNLFKELFIRYSELFSNLLRNENVSTSGYEEIYFYIAETLDDAKMIASPNEKWFKDTYCELDLEKYKISSKEEQSKMLFNSLKRGLLLITELDHLNKEKIYNVLKNIEDNGFETELTYMSKSKNNIMASIVFKLAKHLSDKTTYYLLLQDKTSNRTGKVKINVLYHWDIHNSLGQLKMKKDKIEIVPKKGINAETYIFDIDKIFKN